MLFFNFEKNFFLEISGHIHMHFFLGEEFCTFLNVNLTIYKMQINLLVGRGCFPALDRGRKTLFQKCTIRR
jgi:hypothetical protein